MEIIKLIALLLGTAILFMSCSTNSPAPTLSYQDEAFRAHISWQINDIIITAFLTSIPSGSGMGKTVTLEITSPSTLEGISLCGKNGDLQARLGSFKIDSAYAERLFAVTSLFDIDATVIKSDVTETEGKKFNLIEAISSDEQKYTLLLFADSGLPRRITSDINGKECVLDVLCFEFIDQN